jgi:drug/metabolite transporter (DMT)-like permease
VLLSVDSLLIRLLTQTLPFTNVIFWRGVGTAIGFSVLAWFGSPRRMLHLFSAIGYAGLAVATLNFIGNALFVIAITHTTVAHALVITATAPVLTAILAQLITGERATVRIWLVSVVVAVGVCLVFLAIPSRGDLVGDLSAVGGAFFLSLNFVILRRAKQVNMIPAFAIGGVLTAGAAAPFVSRFTLSPRETTIAFLAGVVVLPLSFGLVVRGLRYLQAPEVSLLILLETILGPLWVFLVLRETPDLRTVLSGSVIFMALAGNTFAEWLQVRSRANLSAIGGGEPGIAALAPDSLQPVETDE